MTSGSVQGSSGFTAPFTALTASQRFGPYELGRGSSRISLDVVVPATGAPDGDFAIEVGNDPAAAAGSVVPECAEASYLAAQPAGGAADFYVETETGANLFWISYARISGGTGCVPVVKVGIKG